MDYYYATINKYEVLMDFNVPLAAAPERLVISLKVGDVIIAVEGSVYVKVPEEMYDKLNMEMKGNHAKALFKEEFVTLNVNIFKKL